MATKEEWSIEELTDTLNQTAATDRDNLIDMDGLPGTGKSTLAIKLCKKGCPWFDMQRDMLYSRQEIIDWVTNAKPGSWGIGDEVINALFKRDFASRGQKFLLRILDMCRDRNLTLILCLPNFWALDKHILDGRLRLRIHVARTGFAYMWKPSTNPFAPDKWYRKYNEVVCHNWDLYQNARRTKGFIGFVQFGDLGVREKEEYLKIKAKKKQMIKELEEREEKENDINKKRSVEFGKNMMLLWLKSNGFLTRGWETRLAEAEGVTKQAIGQKLKAFEERYGDVLGDSKVNVVNQDTIYNITGNNDNFDENDGQIGHRAE